MAGCTERFCQGCGFVWNIQIEDNDKAFRCPSCDMPNGPVPSWAISPVGCGTWVSNGTVERRIYPDVKSATRINFRKKDELSLDERLKMAVTLISGVIDGLKTKHESAEAGEERSDV